MKGRFLTAAVVLAWCACAWADGDTVNWLLRTIRAALERGQPDAVVAQVIEDMRLGDHLDDATIEELQSEGAGPRSVDALERLRDMTYGLGGGRTMKLFDAPPPPPIQEQGRLIDQAQDFVAAQAASLPNFVCTEAVRRYKLVDGARWKTLDELTWEVGYAEKHESRRLIEADGPAAARRVADGTTSTGEYGDLLAATFRKGALTRFAWDRWANLRGKRAAVFAFSIPALQGALVLRATGRGGDQSAAVGVQGWVYLDPGTAKVRRLIYDSDHVPLGFPILTMHTVVDYGEPEIGGARYTLPLHSSLRMVTRGELSRNVTDFENYRKFTTDTKITFEKP